MNKYLLIGLLSLIVLGAYYGYNILYPKPTNQINKIGTENLTYTLDQIAQHKDSESCWTAIEGKVYDLTPFVKSGFHPGKDAILKGCGIDSTELFNTRPMGTGTPHSERARELLPQYLIGELAN